MLCHIMSYSSMLDGALCAQDTSDDIAVHSFRVYVGSGPNPTPKSPKPYSLNMPKS